MAFVIGIDSSTQSTKAELREIESGKLIATGKAAHPPTQPPVSEQDPEAWWKALVEAVQQLGDARSEAVAISVAGQQHGLALVDEHGVSLRAAKLWNDTTSAPNADRLVEELGADWWSSATGSVPVAAFTVTKLAYVAEHEPEVIERVAKVMLPHDYLTWRLSGEHVTDRGDASGTGWFDATRNQYLPEPVNAALNSTVDWAERLPRVLGPTEAAGQIQPSVAIELGLSDAVVVGPGTGDNMGAALGLGLGLGDVVMSLGTSGTVYAKSERRTTDPTGAVAGFADATGAFLPLVCTLNATKVTDSVAKWLGTDAPGLAELALAAGTASISPVLVPYFDGERTPNRPESKGIFVGLTNEVTREELARAAHDGVICGLLEGLSALEDCGGSSSGRLLLVGGGARSGAYRQRLADISGKAVHIPDSEETVATGAALQAAVIYQASAPTEAISSSVFNKIASQWSLHSSQIFEPNADILGSELRDQYRQAASFDDGLCRVPSQSL